MYHFLADRDRGRNSAARQQRRPRTAIAAKRVPNQGGIDF
jgi:hypothetical protein